MEKELKKHYSSKSSQISDISTKIIKDNIDIATPTLDQKFNKSLELGKFPSKMKFVDVTPFYRTNKDHYRPISIFPNLSKVFERPLITNFLYFLIRFFDKYQCCFRKALMLSIV